MMKSSIFVFLLAACSVRCNIPNCTNNTKNELKKAADCADIFEMGHNKSGIYEIWPMNRIMEGKSLTVYCDMDTAGGGWTVIQRRGDFKNPKDYFYKDWKSYKEGFGNKEEDFWLGNDNIFAISNQKQYSVRFDLEDFEQTRKYAVYDTFWIDHEINKYTLHISDYSGDAGDAMYIDNGTYFTTFDQDNDNYILNCAVIYKGAWWYSGCSFANLNGLYHKENYTGNDMIRWTKWKYESLAWIEIKIRPKNFETGFSFK